MSGLVIALGLSGASAHAEPAALVQTLEALHLRRDDPAAQREFREVLARAAPADREDFEVLWRAARFEIWMGDVAEQPAQKVTFGSAAAGLAQRAIARQPQRVEGHYYAAIGIGLYCQGVGIVKILREGRDREFTAELDRALAIDPFFDRGGPLLAKGRYHFELPWPMRSVKKALEYYRRILARYPYRPRARLFLAEALLADGKAAQAKAELDRLCEGERSQDPVECRRARVLSRPVEAKIKEELED